MVAIRIGKAGEPVSRPRVTPCDALRSRVCASRAGLALVARVRTGARILWIRVPRRIQSNRHLVPVEQDVHREQFHVTRWTCPPVLTPAIVGNGIQIDRYRIIDGNRLRSHVTPFESNAPIGITHRRGRQALTLAIAKRIDRTRVIVIALFIGTDRRGNALILRFAALAKRTLRRKGVTVYLTQISETVRVACTRCLRRRGAHTRRQVLASNRAARLLPVAERSVVAVRRPAADKPLRAVRVRITQRAGRIVARFRRPGMGAGIGRFVAFVQGAGDGVGAIDRSAGAAARRRTLACNAARSARRTLRAARTRGLRGIAAYKGGCASRISGTNRVDASRATLLRLAHNFVRLVFQYTGLACGKGAAVAHFLAITIKAVTAFQNLIGHLHT